MLSRFKISSENYDISCKLLAPDGEPELELIVRAAIERYGV